MGKFKIALIGLFSKLGLLSCYTLNSDILDDQGYSLELPDIQEGIGPSGAVQTVSDSLRPLF